ncbi:Uncharacterized protein FWK35_00039375, partial [Aphis craccivora]
SIFKLPNETALRNWTSTVNGEPGFFIDVFEALKTLKLDNRDCNLVLDAMSIKKQVIWDKKAHKFIGYCDFGGQLNIEGSETAATEALVFMLVGLTGKWKIPVGYVFQNKLNAMCQAQLVKAVLTLAHNSGLRVWGVTFDGAVTNFSTFKILGCELSNNVENCKPWIKHPVDNSQVFIIPDACHMLKLARNTLGNTLVLESPSGLIKWNYFENLHQLQTEMGLKFANKLTGVHIGWKKNKMKVKIAAQLLSSSTANALQFLLDNNFQQFKNSEATIQYCRVIDQIFDFLNSRNPFSKGYKTPIFRSNIGILQDKIIPLINYLSTLKYKNQLLYMTNKKTFIIGFTAAVKSMFEVSKIIFTENLNFKYILTYSFSQDHIEILFGRFRQRFGANNNPNVMQFKTAMKQILLKNAIKCSNNSNCNTFDEDITLSIFSFTWPSK